MVLNYDVLQRFMGIDFEREMIKIPIDNDNVVDEPPF